MENKLFDYENYMNLLKAVGMYAKKGDEDASSDFETIKKIAQSFLDYVSAVDSTETEINIAYERYDDSDLREHVSNCDNYRHICHNAAIVKVSLLNKLAECYVGKDRRIFLGNAENRREVAEFCLDFAVIIFQHRRL